jgi:hypothetical protein
VQSRQAVYPFLLIVCLVLSCFSQTETATVSGRITDEQGAVVQGAELVITNADTNLSSRQQTNNQGMYVFSGLKPGRYRINVTKGGFRTVNLTDVVLNVQDLINQNFQLQVGSVSESVTVVADSAMVNTSSASVSTVVDRHFVENLPLNGRSFNTLLQLTPGVVIAPANANSPGQFSINGQRTNANSFSVDGVSANFGVNANNGLQQAGAGGTQAVNAYGGTNSLVSVDAMQEFRVETSTFAPEFGRTPGGQVIISTRSGTNELHGEAFDYFRNDVLDANDWFANKAGLPRAAERQNDFGGVLGGPLLHNRTFFFVSYEGLRLLQPRTIVLTVPSAGVRAAATPGVTPFIDAYPVPNGADFGNGTARFTGNFSNTISSDATSFRIDHNLKDNLSLFGRYSYSPSSIGSRVSGAAETDIRAFTTRTLTVGTEWLFTPSLANSARFNYSTEQAGQDSALNSFGGSVPPAPGIVIPPPLSMTSSGALFSPLDTNSYIVGHVSQNHVRQFNVVENIGTTRSTHHLKFGVDYDIMRLMQENPQAIVRYSITTPIQTFASTGTAGLVTVIASRPTEASFQAVSIYAQDTWNVTRRAAITYGLRWEFNPAPAADGATVLASWMNVDNPAAIALAPAGTPPWKTRYDNFAPRFGFAYQLSESGDLVVRTGWGMFYDLGTGLAPSLLNQFPNTATKATPSQHLPLTNVDALSPSFSIQPPFQGSVIDGFAPNLRVPYSYQWNLAVEKSFGTTQSLSMTYVGQQGRGLLRQQVIPKPNSNFTGVFDLTVNGDTSSYNALQLQYRRPLAKRFQALFNYTWSHSIDTNSSDVAALAPDNVVSKSQDRGSSTFDVRDSFGGALTYNVPAIGTKGFVSELTKGWSVASYFQARTGFPIDVTTRRAPIPGFASFLGLVSVRPDLVPGQPIWISDPTVPGGRRLNINAFVVQPQGRQGSLGRDSIQGFGATQVDLSLARQFRIIERVKLQIQADMFNLVNHPNFANPPASIDSLGSFGVANQMLNQGLSVGGFGLSPLYQLGGPRSTQFSAKLTF